MLYSSAPFLSKTKKVYPDLLISNLNIGGKSQTYVAAEKYTIVDCCCFCCKMADRLTQLQDAINMVNFTLLLN